MKLSSLLRAFRVALAALAMTTTAAMATIDPIPSVDIIVKKKPHGLAVVVATTDASGKFSARLAEPGDYTVSTACHPKAVCVPYTFTASINASGLTKSGPGTMTFTITVKPEAPAVLSGIVVRLSGGYSRN
jgi:hypothetical protein